MEGAGVLPPAPQQPEGVPVLQGCMHPGRLLGFLRDRLVSALASVQENLPPTRSPVGLLGFALEPGRTFPVNSCTEEVCCCELLHSNERKQLWAPTSRYATGLDLVLFVTMQPSTSKLVPQFQNPSFAYLSPLRSCFASYRSLSHSQLPGKSCLGPLKGNQPLSRNSPSFQGNSPLTLF